MSNRRLPRPLALALLLAARAHADVDPQGTVTPALFERVTIAPISEALTFARVERQGVRRVLAVRRYRNGRVEGVDLGADDPIALFLADGYDALRRRIAAAPAAARVSVPARDLGIPVDLRDHHLATGLNFPAHAGESGAGDEPFLFPKLTRPTDPYAPVAVEHRLLDYEVEVAWVPLRPLGEGDRPATMGLILCNDYTDRETLLRTLDPWHPGSGKGFTTVYLQPGDRVAIHVERLGVIDNEVIP